MNNPRLAGRYAKSLLDLAAERNNLELVFADIKFLRSLAKSNKDLVAVLNSPVIGSEKKEKILEAILKPSVQPLTYSFLLLLLRKTRESNLFEIVRAFIEQYNKLKGIHLVKITTAAPISEELKNSIVSKVKTDAGVEHIELESVVNEAIIGGFKLEMEGNLVDASVLRDLRDVKKQFSENIYQHKIR